MLGKYVLATDEGMSETNCVEVKFGVDSRLRQKDCSQQNSSLPVQASSKPVARKSFLRSRISLLRADPQIAFFHPQEEKAEHDCPY